MLWTVISSIPISLIITLLLDLALLGFIVFRPRQDDANNVKELESLLDHERQKRHDDRLGRTRAEKLLREQRQTICSGAIQLKPIGYIRSVFNDRRGTPRQSLLAAHARAELVLEPFVQPVSSLSGLETFSHIWIIAVFHENTDIIKSQEGKFKAKIAPPRLNGEKQGIFATRSPHRPNPIALSLGRIESISGNRILLSGVDLISGTPVLDIKPYVERYDALTGTTCPEWITSDFAQGSAPLSVCFPEQVQSQLLELVSDLEFYDDASSIRSLIEEVLENDIRSLYQRSTPKPTNIYLVRLDRLLIRYSVKGDNLIQIHDVALSGQDSVPAS